MWFYFPFFRIDCSRFWFGFFLISIGAMAPFHQPSQLTLATAFGLVWTFEGLEISGKAPSLMGTNVKSCIFEPSGVDCGECPLPVLPSLFNILHPTMSLTGDS